MAAGSSSPNSGFPRRASPIGLSRHIHHAPRAVGIAQRQALPLRQRDLATQLEQGAAVEAALSVSGIRCSTHSAVHQCRQRSDRLDGGRRAPKGVPTSSPIVTSHRRLLLRPAVIGPQAAVESSIHYSRELAEEVAVRNLPLPGGSGPPGRQVVLEWHRGPGRVAGPPAPRVLSW